MPIANAFVFTYDGRTMLQGPVRGVLPFWFIPMLYAAGAIVLSAVLPRIENHYLGYFTTTISVSSAVAFYSAVASGMLALTGIVFSLIFVMVTFSASAYSPRIVLWIARDRSLSHSLGVFTATFIYALAALAWVDRDHSGMVGQLSAGCIVLLLFASIAVLGFLVQRVGLLRISSILRLIGKNGRRVIHELYPRLEEDAPGSAAGHRPPPADAQLPPVTQTIRHSGNPSAVEAVNAERLFSLAIHAGAVIEIVYPVGDMVFEGTPLLNVRGAGGTLPERQLRKAIWLNSERTFAQDPKYLLRLLVDVSIKALSPAINDPTTAVQALDEISDLLGRLGRRDLDIGRRYDADDALRLTIPTPSWEDYLSLACDEIRLCGSTSPQVMRRMRAMFHDLMDVVPPGRRAALERQCELLDHSIDRSFADGEDRIEARKEDRQGLGMPRRRP
jgi:uncharacterized membrane protein